MHYKHTSSSLRSQYLGNAGRTSAASREETISACASTRRSQRASRGGSHIVSRDRPISGPVLTEALRRQDSAHQPDQALSPLYSKTVAVVSDGSLAHEKTPPFPRDEPVDISVHVNSDSGSGAPAWTPNNRDSIISYAQNDHGITSNGHRVPLRVVNASSIPSPRMLSRQSSYVEYDQDVTVPRTQSSRNSTIEYAQIDRGIISNHLHANLQVANFTMNSTLNAPSNRDSTGSYVYTDRGALGYVLQAPLTVMNPANLRFIDTINEEPDIQYDQRGEETRRRRSLGLVNALPEATQLDQLDPNFSTHQHQLEHSERVLGDDDGASVFRGNRKIHRLSRSASAALLRPLKDGFTKVRALF
ncbi:hypothetical protein HBI56_201700 [Parastagonospora nodorum]|uniref:Uncharacterized protein n=2 Tax=Phaeosphaeria nodorum (strain SN15 / ATCC MYA-4574 / FGSC 10173) TaxID=321614 RepID=A0A7U2EZM5_PHANO|nr:hypothetical protein SNOG_15585 [Parastagonospora nodorum SN15]KAH3905644.1 hypothetical protein HBH56_216230 [Parastagonospora nodorum]EAT76960.1 hypothetical protein SNOG_15585 [Parastagonospora nodorum SN15]KAH3922689.1 hypothetical protein HBH54_221290 [Parastagonospora nodorum]KAH3942095.1 hypothetical protein HBH53_191200 [Parastagonospora nodorum]KAH3961326.1 hypothetical protein HBH51_184910 [Parastagonospora nodorum]